MRTILIILLILTSSAFATIVVIQPGPAAGIDTTLKKQLPTMNFGDATGIDIDGSSTLTQVFLLKFNLTSYSYATINSAYLHLYAFAGSGNGNLALNRVTSPWGEMVATWNNAPSYDSAAVTQPICPNFSWTIINITAIVQYWVDHPGQNYGLRGRAQVTNVRRAFRSSDNNYNPYQSPKLVMEYGATPVEPISLGDIKALFK